MSQIALKYKANINGNSHSCYVDGQKYYIVMPFESIFNTHQDLSYYTYAQLANYTQKKLSSAKIGK